MKRRLSFIAIFLVILILSSNLMALADNDKQDIYKDFYYKAHTRNGIDGIEITGYKGSDSYVAIPDFIDKKPVISIGLKCFSGKDFILDFSFPKSIIHFADYAFGGTNWLKNYPDDFVIVNNVLIKYKSKDRNISQVIVPDNVKVINYGAFDFYMGTNDPYKFSSISLPLSLETIYPEAFYGCEELSKISIPKNVSLIEPTAFKNCFSLEKIDVHKDNQHYSSSLGVLLDKNQETLLLCPQGMFSPYVVPETVNIIAKNAFYNCTNIPSIVLPKNLIEIQDYAFVRCFSLTEINIPNSVTGIGYWAFGECKNIKKVKLSTKIKSIDDMAFISCENLKEIKISDDVRFVGDYAFGKIFNWINNYQGEISDVKNFKIKIDNKGNVNPLKSKIVSYAKKFNIPYTLLNDYEREMGDINGNGKIEAADARLALRASAQIMSLTPFQELACDVNKDGKITASDARKILRVSAKIDSFDE